MGLSSFHFMCPFSSSDVLRSATRHEVVEFCKLARTLACYSRILV